MKSIVLKSGALTLMLLCTMVMHGQQMITVSQNNAKTKEAATLNGKASVIFLANSDDMVITTNINKDKQAPKAVKVGKQFKYEMVFDISQGSTRIFTVAKYGTTNSHKTNKIKLVANKQLCFDIDQVENGIDLKIDPNSEIGWINGKKSEALIIINSKIKLTIDSPKLKCQRRTGRGLAGTYLDSLIIDVSKFADLTQEESIIADELEKAIEKRDKEQETMDDATFNALMEKIPLLMEKKDSVSSLLADMLRVEVYGDKTNKMTIDYNDIKTMKAKSLLRYNVIILNETKVVVETQYGELLRQADNEFQDRQYARAANFYRLAANEKNISAEQRTIANDKAQAALRYDTISVRAEKYAKLINEVISSGRDVKKSLLIKSFDQAIMAYRSLANSTGDTYFKNQLEKLIAEKDKIGIILEGKTLYSELHQGLAEESALGGCKFYGVSGSLTEDMTSNVYWKNDHELATSGSDGAFKFQVKAGEYDYIIVVGAHNGKIKRNKAIPMKGRGDSKLKIVFGKK